MKPLSEQGLSHADLLERLEKIAALCRRYNSAAVNTGAHALATKVLGIAEGNHD